MVSELSMVFTLFAIPFGICLGSQLWVAVEAIKIQQLSEEQQQEREERSRCSIYHWLRIFWD
jgi:hypothetical protein